MPSDRPSVLIVEDNRAMSQVLRFNFERSGFAVGHAYDGREALRELEGGHFDLVITDYQMPHMDGAELCRQIREVLMLTELPICLCSAKGLETDAANLVARHGIRHVFFKPVSPQAVVAFARKLLESSGLASSSPLAQDHTPG